MAEMTKEGETQLVVFVLASEEFACNIADVREVLKMIRVTPLPRSLDFVEGVINLRGEVIPVIDLRKRFGLPAVERTDESRIIIVEVEERMVGLTVDSVSEVIRLNNKQIQEAPNQVAGEQTNLIMGVGKIDDRMLIILNLERILTSEEQIALAQISQAGKELARE
ncbi:MAG: chemotaxis protein CheW [Dethiobacteria bacterium]|nr:chemotaxis protein CheW [Dethiobacteria bacterium]